MAGQIEQARPIQPSRPGSGQAFKSPLSNLRVSRASWLTHAPHDAAGRICIPMAAASSCVRFSRLAREDAVGRKAFCSS